MIDWYRHNRGFFHTDHLRGLLVKVSAIMLYYYCDTSTNWLLSFC